MLFIEITISELQIKHRRFEPYELFFPGQWGRIRKFGVPSDEKIFFKHLDTPR
jgi:hypothetical protein